MNKNIAEVFKRLTKKSDGKEMRQIAVREQRLAAEETRLRKKEAWLMKREARIKQLYNKRQEHEARRLKEKGVAL